jgi:hypothetical protein
VLAKRDENTVSGRYKSPEEEYGNQGAESPIVGWLFDRAHLVKG